MKSKKVKKIVFVEPYVSKGGHNYKHFQVIPRNCIRKNIPYVFIAERTVATRNKDVRTSLMPFCEIQKLSRDEYLRIRKKKYQELITHYRNDIIFFLTTHTSDFRVWIELLRNSQIRRTIKKNKQCIIIHSACEIYPTLLDLASEEKGILKEMNEYVFFSFYSTLQAGCVSSLVPGISALDITLPIYDDFFMNKTKELNKNGPMTFLGRYEDIKNPHVLVDLRESCKNERFLTHFYPLSNENSILFFTLLKRSTSRDIFYTSLINQKTYIESVCNAKIGLLPYDSYEYAFRASGILEEYMLAGVPVVVPKDTWLSWCLKEHNGAGVVYDEKERGGCVKAVRQLLGRYDHYKKKACVQSDIFYTKMNITSFYERIMMLDQKRHVGCTKKRKSNPEYSRIIKKGRAHFYVSCVETKVREGNTEGIYKLLAGARTADPSYWKLRIYDTWVKNKTVYATVIFDIFEKTKTHNPFYMVQCLWGLGRMKFLSMCVDTEKYMKKIIHRAWKAVPLTCITQDARKKLRFLCTPTAQEKILSKCNTLAGTVRPSVYYGLFLYHMKKFETAAQLISHYCRYVIKHKQKKTVLREAHDVLNQLPDLGKLAAYPSCIALCRELIDVVMYKEKITDLDNYHYASLLKKMGDLNKAHQSFFYISSHARNNTLRSGALYHCADISAQLQAWQDVAQYAQACLQLNSHHTKAKVLLDQSEGDMG